jgi:thioesterase domain-containing protein
LGRRTKLELRKAQAKRIAREPMRNLREIWLRRSRRVFPHKDANPFLRVEQATLRAFHNYHPTPFEGGAVLYRTYKDEYVGDIEWAVDEYNGWRELIRGEIEVHPMPGTHHSVCLTPEYASVLGAAMRRSFESALQSRTGLVT